MIGDPIKTDILSIRLIPNADKMLLRKLKVATGHRSLGIISTNCDDVSYAALDEATKKADVKVAYARSMYAGSNNASTLLAGEFIGILSADNPEDIKSGMEAAKNYIENVACFYSANNDDSIVYFAHCISQTGTYLSDMAKVGAGTAMSYLIAPPVEAVCGLDEALKASDVQIKVFFGPPTETNFAGGLLVGDQAACKAACEAFAETVCRVAQTPIEEIR